MDLVSRSLNAGGATERENVLQECGADACVCSENQHGDGGGGEVTAHESTILGEECTDTYDP